MPLRKGDMKGALDTQAARPVRGAGFTTSIATPPQESIEAPKQESTNALTQQSKEASKPKSVKAEKPKSEEAGTLESMSAEKRKRSKADIEAAGFRNQGVNLRVSYVNAFRKLALEDNRFMYELMDDAMRDYLRKRGIGR